jgi:hypothetical protein
MPNIFRRPKADSEVSKKQLVVKDEVLVPVCGSKCLLELL